MQSGSSPQGESLDSTAKMMQEALNKASSELEKTVEILLGHLALFNQSLEKQFQTEIKAVDDRLESALKQNLDLMSREKDELTKSLAAHRHAEIEAVIHSGKEVRTKLHTEITQAAQDLQETVSSRIKAMKEALAQPQAAQEAASALKDQLAKAQSGAKVEIQETTRRGEDFCSTAAATFQKRLAEAITQSQSPSTELADTEKTRLAEESARLKATLAQKQVELSQRLTASVTSSLEHVAEAHLRADNELKSLYSDTDGLGEPLEQSFDQSLSGVTGVLHGQYDKKLRNILAQSRTEILVAVAQSEEKVQSTRADLELTLRGYQRDYVEAINAHLARFQKAIEQEVKEKGQGSSRELREERVREQLSAVFRRIGQEILQSASQAASQMETDFQRSMEVFEKRIEHAKDSASESLERESKLMQKELSRSFQDFEKQLGELELQLNSLERAGRDAADIVLTIRRANLSF